MKTLFRDIDGVLRGRFTRKEDLREGKIAIPSRTLVRAGLLLGCLYGVFMGLYGVLRPANPSFLQLVASTVKLPLLFLLTLAVTLPSLYVFSALCGSRLQIADTLRLLLAALTINLALLASFGPVTGFFTLSTQSYPFMVVLNVLLCGISGIAGLVFLRRALDALFEPPPRRPPPPPRVEPAEASATSSTADPPAAPGTPIVASKTLSVPPPYEPPRPVERARLVFRTWMVIFAVVGAQMSWILRPFIGDPNRGFEWFRERQSNFFAAVMNALKGLFS